MWPVSLPFYSTFKMPDLPLGLPVQAETPVDAKQQIAWVDNSYYVISFYVDQHQLISTALAVLALNEEVTSTKKENDWLISGAKADRSHGWSSQVEYIEAHALPPYVRKVHELSK